MFGIHDQKWLDNAMKFGGHFVHNFAKAMVHADEENLVILMPVFRIMTHKYPKYFEELPTEKRNEAAH